MNKVLNTLVQTSALIALSCCNGEVECKDCGWDWGASEFHVSKITLSRLENKLPEDIFFHDDVLQLNVAGYIGSNFNSLELTVEIDEVNVGMYEVANPNTKESQSPFEFSTSAAIELYMSDVTNEKEPKIVVSLTDGKKIMSEERSFDFWNKEYFRKFVTDIWGSPAEISMQPTGPTVISGETIQFSSASTYQIELLSFLGKPSCLWKIEQFSSSKEPVLKFVNPPGFVGGYCS